MKAREELLRELQQFIDEFKFARPADKPGDFAEKDGSIMSMPLFAEDEYQDMLFQMHALHDLVALLKELQAKGGIH